MFETKQMRVKYVEAMEKYDDYGRALWKPPYNSDLKIGHLGFFDEGRQWNSLCDITKEASIQDSEVSFLSTMTVPIKTMIRPDTWGPRTSSNATLTAPSLDLGAT
jgi:hypothetical protein